MNLGRFLGALERLGMAAGNISVVLNKAEDDTGLDAVDMAAQLGRRFEAIVPYSRDVSRSVNVGVPLIVGKPKSPIAKLLTTALATVLPGHRKPAPVAVRPVGAGCAAVPVALPALATVDPAPGPDRSTRRPPPVRRRTANRRRSTSPSTGPLLSRRPPGRGPSAAAGGRRTCPLAIAAEAGDRPDPAPPADPAHLAAGGDCIVYDAGSARRFASRRVSDADRYCPTRTRH